jgi:phenylacetic acid degradation operon negative regulatory protein
MDWKLEARDWLTAILWGVDAMMRPTLPRLLESYEAWERRGRVQQQWRRLERQELIRREKEAGRLVCRLTEAGRLAALGGIDPLPYWERPWDGWWRLLLFDLPSREKPTRMRLWRWLREQRFGYLQNSVWVRPEPVGEIAARIRTERARVETLTVMEARCCPGYPDREVVTAAWDLAEAHRRHRAYMDATEAGWEALRCEQTPAGLRRFLRRERLDWATALAADPLLPRELQPPGYLGEKAFTLRRQTLGAASRMMLGL